MAVETVVGLCPVPPVAIRAAMLKVCWLFLEHVVGITRE
jgi:hypothetical protein